MPQVGISAVVISRNGQSCVKSIITLAPLPGCFSRLSVFLCFHFLLHSRRVTAVYIIYGALYVSCTQYYYYMYIRVCAHIASVPGGVTEWWWWWRDVDVKWEKNKNRSSKTIEPPRLYPRSLHDDYRAEPHTN